MIDVSVPLIVIYIIALFFPLIYLSQLSPCHHFHFISSLFQYLFIYQSFLDPFSYYLLCTTHQISFFSFLFPISCIYFDLLLQCFGFYILIIVIVSSFLILSDCSCCRKPPSMPFLCLQVFVSYLLPLLLVLVVMVSVDLLLCSFCSFCYC